MGKLWEEQLQETMGKEIVGSNLYVCASRQEADQPQMLTPSELLPARRPNTLLTKSSTESLWFHMDQRQTSAMHCILSLRRAVNQTGDHTCSQGFLS